MNRAARLATLLALSLLVVAPHAAAGEDDPAVTKTRFGTLVVVDDESDPFLKTLTLDGKEILRFEGMALTVDELHESGNRDLALVARGNGGNACPLTLVIVQLEAGKAPLLSEGFGTCSDLYEARLVKDALVVEMPRYVNHPELWEEKELEEALTTKLIYTWAEGRLTEKKAKK